MKEDGRIWLDITKINQAYDIRMWAIYSID